MADRVADFIMQRAHDWGARRVYGYAGDGVGGLIGALLAAGHRVAFFERMALPKHGKLQIEDYGAESMSLKRVLENKAGNLDSFGRGMSYISERAA